jgi:membrane-bound lytic murein transglycosylase A
MVHHTMPIKIKPAPRASSKSSVMQQLRAKVAMALIVGTLAACSSGPAIRPYTSAPAPAASPAVPASSMPTGGGGVLQQPRSRWLMVPWSELPGFTEDNISEAWGAWLKSCERSAPPLDAQCPEVRRMSTATPAQQRAWLQSRFQPYRVESGTGDPTGLLTGYYEPTLEASRLPTATHTVPLYQPPANLLQRKPWYSRQEIDTLPEAQAALRGRAIAYLADPIDAMVLHIQGSGRLRITQPDGSQRWVRLGYAGNNEHPYRSLGRYLLDQGQIKDGSWPGIKAWIAQNPQRLQELLWANPRVIFFKEEPLPESEIASGPKGAQGVALTPGRSIAVDPLSIPYGAPIWMASTGQQISLQRLVLAQDTGSAISGAVRGDYFVGWGPQAADLAGRLRQPLQMWVIWPK